MTDETKDPNHVPGAEPEDNPWDDDDGGGRTLATDGPSFDMPSNIPSPISNPPPPMAIPEPPPPVVMPVMPALKPAPGLPGARARRQATMIGIPAPAIGSAAAPPAPAAPRPVAPSAPGSPLSAPRPPSPSTAGASPPPSIRNPVPPPSARMAPVPSTRGSVRDAPRPPASSRTSVMEHAPVDAAPAAAVTPPPAPAEEDDFPNAVDQDDGPTMAVASPVTQQQEPPLRDDVLHPRSSPLASTGFTPDGAAEVMRAMHAMDAMPAAPRADKDAETVAMAGDDPRLPPPRGAPPAPPPDEEEHTRSVPREELMRHQDAQLVVGSDAMGDEATLAVGPGQLDLGPGGAGIAAALQEALQQREPSRPDVGPPAFQPFASPPAPPAPMGVPHPPQPSWHGEPQGYPPPTNPGMQGMQGAPPAYPSSGRQPIMQPYPPQQGHPGPPNDWASPVGPGSYPGQGMVPQPQQPWMTPPGAPMSPTGLPRPPSRFPPQVILLVVVGGVCLAIFVTGIVLFVTTKF